MTADELATQLKNLIGKWQRTHIPYAVWVEAWDVVEEMVALDFPRAEKAGELLMAEYEKWIAKEKQGPDWEWAQRVEQGVLL